VNPEPLIFQEFGPAMLELSPSSHLDVVSISAVVLSISLDSRHATLMNVVGVAALAIWSIHSYPGNLSSAILLGFKSYRSCI
jgi:hypothetical protein